MGVHGPCILELWPRAGPATGYTFFQPTSETLVFSSKQDPVFLGQLGMVCANPPFYWTLIFGVAVWSPSLLPPGSPKWCLAGEVSHRHVLASAASFLGHFNRYYVSVFSSPWKMSVVGKIGAHLPSSNHSRQQPTAKSDWTNSSETYYNKCSHTLRSG